MLTFALLFVAQAAPQQGPIKPFADRLVACDNVKRCEMTSLLPEQGGPTAEAPQMSIVREPGPAGGWTVELMPAAVASGLRLAIEGAPAAIVAAIIGGKAAIVTDPAGKASGRAVIPRPFLKRRGLRSMMSRCL